MIKAFSQRLTPPYSGQIHIAESDSARTLTMDGNTWEVHFAKNSINSSDSKTNKRSYRRVAYISHKQMLEIPVLPPEERAEIDQRIIELATFIRTATLPFPATDRFEYWLLDPTDGLPLALVFSCTEARQMETYPTHAEWTALPAAVLPIEKTDEEKQSGLPPVNYRLESLVASRAGTRPKARWYERYQNEPDIFPPFMVREDWPEPADSDLCQRYLKRQSTRLLMLHNLKHEDRLRMEMAAKDHIFEVERLFKLYPDVADERLMNAMRVEARLRGAEAKGNDLQNRRDGVHYQ